MKPYHEVIITDPAVFDKFIGGQKVEATISIDMKDKLNVEDKIEVYLKGNSSRDPHHSGRVVSINDPVDVNPKSKVSTTIYVTIQAV